MFNKVKRFFNSNKTLRLVVDFLGMIIIWRGVWGLLDMYVFPGRPLLSYLTSIALGIVLLVIDGDGLDDLKNKTYLANNHRI